MSVYTLNPAFRSSGRCECIVTVSLDGVKQSPDDVAFATLFDVQHYNGSMAFVCVPNHVYQANASHLEQAPDFIASDGTCSFDFDSHEAALDFLRHLYGIDAPENPTSPTQQTAEPIRTKEKKITISMMVEPSLYEEVKRLAELQGRSVGGQIRHAIKQNLRSSENLLPGASIHTPTANASPVIHNGL